jgi:hypothetical protein
VMFTRERKGRGATQVALDGSAGLCYLF